MRGSSSPSRSNAACALFITTSLAGCIGAGFTPIADDAALDRGEDVARDVVDASVEASVDVIDAGVDGPVDVTLPPTPLFVQPARWNATGADVGAIAAVAEPENLLALFGQRGLQVLAGGAVSATDATVTAWRAASLIPAGDGSTTPWALGIADDGRLWRVRDRMRLEEVTARYALTSRRVRSVATLSSNRVAFGFEGGFAVADGMQVSLWSDPSFASLVGAAGRLAALTTGGVRVFDVAANMMVMYPLADASSVAFGADDRLIVTAGNDLYVESASGSLVPRVIDGSVMRGVVRSAARVWLVAGTSLALWDGRELHASADVQVAAGATLLPSPSGDVWVLTAGALTRYGFVESPDLRQWEDTVRPVFATRCVPCHLPGGTGNLDLSIYSAWQMRRVDIRTQVMTRRAMPPPPGMLSTAERAAIAAWLDADGGVRDAAVDAPRTDATADAPRTDATADAPRTDASVDVPRTDASLDVRG